MHPTFPNLGFGLMVGIGSGVPRNDSRLGGIAVSLPSEQGGGVIQYDLGRQEADGFHPLGGLNKPRPLLPTAITCLGATCYLARESTVIVSQAFDEDEDTEEEWRYPRTTEDIIFSPNYLHHDGRSDCDKCLKSCQWCCQDLITA